LNNIFERELNDILPHISDIEQVCNPEK